MKQIRIANKLYSVASTQEYRDFTDSYNPKYTAIDFGNETLPIKSKMDTGPGVYYQSNWLCGIIQHPEESQMNMYSSSNIIDYTNSKDIDDIINKNNLVRDIENDILTTKDNIFHLNPDDKDSPEMASLKEAVNDKEMDVKQYAYKFEQFNNDMRMLKKSNTISFGKLISTCNNFDIKATLILEDKSPNVPNPIGRKIETVLTGGYEDGDEK